MKIEQLPRTTRKVIALILGSAALTAFAGPAFAQGGSLVGVWGATIQGRDCATNAALGAPSRALYTYYQDGTLLESPGAPIFAPGQRSVGHGNWTQSGSTFTERVVGLFLFDTPPGTPAGSPGFQ